MGKGWASPCHFDSFNVAKTSLLLSRVETELRSPIRRGMEIVGRLAGFHVWALIGPWGLPLTGTEKETVDRHREIQCLRCSWEPKCSIVANKKFHSTRSDQKPFPYLFWLHLCPCKLSFQQCTISWAITDFSLMRFSDTKAVRSGEMILG